VTDADDLDAFIDATLERLAVSTGRQHAGASSASSVAESTDDLWRADYELK